jgi:hypothetical protein
MYQSRRGVPRRLAIKWRRAGLNCGGVCVLVCIMIVVALVLRRSLFAPIGADRCCRQGERGRMVASDHVISILVVAYDMKTCRCRCACIQKIPDQIAMSKHVMDELCPRFRSCMCKCDLCISFHRNRDCMNPNKNACRNRLSMRRGCHMFAWHILQEKC